MLGMTIWAFRISYVGEQGWELYFPFGDGLKLWDALAELDVTPGWHRNLRQQPPSRKESASAKRRP